MMTHLVDAVQKMQDYISTHLDKEITLADLANVALYSPWYCYRIFKEYTGTIPAGFDIISLPACDYLMFQGEPFAEEDFEQAILSIWDAEKKYNPSVLGLRWDSTNPRIQLEPLGERGYIELVAVKEK